ncbi:MAG: hypothetical protein ACWGNV_15320 [Bacteroidales bacterium]
MKISFAGRSNWLKLILELIAVFVGITAGFFFENFRQDRADRIQEQKFMTSFLSNVQVDSSVIHSSLDNFQNNLDISLRTLEAMDSSVITVDSAMLMMGVIGTYDDMYLQDATYASIISTGKLDLIRDYELRDNILKYYQSVKSMQFVEGLYNHYLNTLLFPYIYEHMDFLTGETYNFDPNGREFRNVSMVYYVMVDARVSQMKELDSLNMVLIESFNDYLE